MSDLRRRFDPSELDAGDDSELVLLLATARHLESFAASEHAAPSVDFEDRVMAAIATDPAPRAMAAGGFVAVIRNAWRLAWSGGRPMAVRAQAFAVILLVVVSVGSVGSLAAVGAARWLAPDGSPRPTLVPSPSPSTSSPAPSPSPSVSPSPTPPPTLSASPTPTVDPSPTDTNEPAGTNNHGGGLDSGSGTGSGGGSGSGDDPTETPDPTEMPDPTETPDATDDSSGHGSDDDAR